MGTDFCFNTFYGIQIDSGIDVSDLERFGLKELNLGEDSRDTICISDESHNSASEVGDSYCGELELSLAGLKELDEKLIKFLQVKNITKFKGPNVFTVGYLT